MISSIGLKNLHCWKVWSERKKGRDNGCAPKNRHYKWLGQLKSGRVNAIPDMDKCSGWNLDRSLNTEQALKDVYNKKKLYSAIGYRYRSPIGFEKEKERKVLNTVS